MTQQDYRRKSPSSVTGNCVTDIKEEANSKAITSARKHSDWEAKQTFIVTKGECRQLSYRRVKKGEKIPEGVIIHKGRI